MTNKETCPECGAKEIKNRNSWNDYECGSRDFCPLSWDEGGCFSVSKQCLINQLEQKEAENAKLREENKKLWNLFESESWEKSIEKVDQELQQAGITGMSFQKAGKLFKKMSDLQAENTDLRAVVCLRKTLPERNRKL